MKILIVGPAHPYRGGIAALNERLAVQLQSEGHDVEIVSFTLQYPGFLFPGTTQYTDAPAPKQLKITRAINSINPFNWIIKGLKYKKTKPDLVIVRYWLPFMGPSTGTLCRLIKKNKHSRILSIVDNILPHENRPGDKLFTRYFTKSVDGFLAMSNSVYSDLDLFIGQKPKIYSPHPVYDHYGEIIDKQEAKKRLNLDQSVNYLLFFGFIRDYKGLDLLLEALTNKELLSHNVKLLVAGEFYSNEKKYYDLIKTLGVEKHVELRTGYIPENEVNLYFCACDIVSQPYKSATQSGVTQIGYHFEKPMLVTNVGGLPEIIAHDKCGYVVEVNSGAISSALIDFYTKQREAEMIKEVKKAKKKFGWDALSKSIFTLSDLCN